MPRPEQQLITFQIDGRDVQAPENIMLVDAAKYGDVEIPVFCYEPKLGAPVGACRMCLVEIEGIPKLQTGCSTPVKDGMVVFTQTDRVKAAQHAVVEFLLINHPLDCPVCDKGGECPLQDITFGWGGGRSRFIEPKRHFRKPLELSPLIAIDRERCILCYRCVRFSQEISEDHQLVLLERGAHSFVGTFDSHPYVAPFSGNIIELCPVGALTSRAYRFRARPWDIEDSGSICTLCPSQCNISYTVRDERAMRVLAREHDGVDDGWLCDKGRFAYQAIHVDERLTEPLLRDAGVLRPVSWERALEEATRVLRRGGAGTAALAGGGTTNEEGLLLARLLRDALGSPHLDSRPGGAVPLDQLRALSAPALQASVPDLGFAHAVLVIDCEPLDEAPIIELRIRKGVRRRGVALAVATSRPSALDGVAAAAVRYAPNFGAAFLTALTRALHGEANLEGFANAAGSSAAEVERLAAVLRDAGEVVVVYGERLLAGGATALLALADALALSGHDGAGLIGIPDSANGRGLREVGCVPNAGPGLSDTAAGRDAPAIAAALADGQLSVLYLLHSDPLRDYPDRLGWEAALERASFVIAHSAFLTEGIREHASLVFPAESAAEKEGTVTHPDGRVQRLRPAIGRPASVRAEWSVLAELLRALGADSGPPSGPLASQALFEAVPLYAGLTLEGLGGRGVRWPELADAAERLPAARAEPPVAPQQAPKPAPGGDGLLRLGTFRSVWAAPEVERSPTLQFLARRQCVELSPADARRLGVRGGEEVLVADDRGQLRARVAVRDAIPAGSVFLEQGIAQDSANALAGPLVRVHRLTSSNGAGATAARAPAEAGA
jgi:NADH-quinone oxidoreductase subunit G